MNNPHEQKRCRQAKESLHRAREKLEHLEDEYNRAYQQAENSIDEANDSVLHAQIELARQGIETTISQIPTKVLGWLSELSSILGISGTPRDAQEKFDRLSRQNDTLRMNAQHDVESLILAENRRDNAESEYQRAENELYQCQER